MKHSVEVNSQEVSKILNAMYGELLSQSSLTTVAYCAKKLPVVSGDQWLLDHFLRWSSCVVIGCERPLPGIFPLKSQIISARDLFKSEIRSTSDSRALLAIGENGTKQIEKFIAFLIDELYLLPGFHFSHRPNREERQQLKITEKRHVYNRKFRVVKRLVLKMEKYKKKQEIWKYQAIGSGRLLNCITHEEFMRDQLSALVVAIAASNKNSPHEGLRWSGQYTDDQALLDALFVRCLNHQVNWPMIALVYPVKEVIDRLDDLERGALLGNWLQEMARLAMEFEMHIDAIHCNPDTLLVTKKGIDFYTWNIFANAWNAARIAFMHLCSTMGMTAFLSGWMPGKVLRLVTDGMRQHDARELAVYSKLPRPWKVMNGMAECTLGDIEQTCMEANLNPMLANWTTYLRLSEDRRVSSDFIMGFKLTAPTELLFLSERLQ